MRASALLEVENSKVIFHRPTDCVVPRLSLGARCSRHTHTAHQLHPGGGKRDGVKGMLLHLDGTLQLSLVVVGKAMRHRRARSRVCVCVCASKPCQPRGDDEFLFMLVMSNGGVKIKETVLFYHHPKPLLAALARLG